jgi:hypothetical protein
MQSTPTFSVNSYVICKGDVTIPKCIERRIAVAAIAMRSKVDTLCYRNLLSPCDQQVRHEIQDQLVFGHLIFERPAFSLMGGGQDMEKLRRSQGKRNGQGHQSRCKAEPQAY